MAQPYGADSQERLSQSLQSPINTYERYLEQYGKELKPVRELCLNNLVEACYFSGDFEKAALYYSMYYSEFGSLYFDAYFDAVYSYDRLKKSTTTYFALDFSGKIERAADEERRLAKLALERQQAADEAAAAADRQERLEALRREVVIRGEGTVTDANGGKHEGTVAFRLASVQSGILDLDAGRTVMLYNAQTDEYIRSFGLKDMTQVEVNNTVYSPVKKASHFVSSSSILKMIYEKGKYRLYYDPGYGRYYIKSAGGDRAYPVTDILKATGLVEEFYLPCPDMKGKLWQEGATGDLLPDELKKLIDRIEQMCP